MVCAVEVSLVSCVKDFIPDHVFAVTGETKIMAAPCSRGLRVVGKPPRIFSKWRFGNFLFGPHIR